MPTRSRAAFEPYYRTTILSEETDPNKLHDLKADSGRLSGLRMAAGRAIGRRFIWRRGPRQTRPDPGCLRCRLHRRPRRGRPGGFQGQGQGFRAHLRLSCRRSCLTRNADMGEALDLPELPHSEAAGAQGGGSFQGHSGSHRHGQLPGRGAAQQWPSPCRCRRGDRSGATQAAAGTSPNRSWIG